MASGTTCFRRAALSPRRNRTAGLKEYTLDKETSGLLIIDVQERLLIPFPEETKRRLFRNLTVIIETARVFNLPVVLTEQYPKGLGATVDAVRGLLPGVGPLGKTFFNCMKDEIIAGAVRGMGRDTVLVCGIETHICVLQTAL